MPGREGYPVLAYRCALQSSGKPCIACGRPFLVGDVMIGTRLPGAGIVEFCRSCVNDMSNAVDELFREEDRGPKEVKP